MLKNFISKEVFKAYLLTCPKIALAMADIEILLKMCHFQKNKQLTILDFGNLNVPPAPDEEGEDEETTSAPIDPLKAFLKYYETCDDEDREEKIAAILALMEEDDFEMEPVVSSFITDGNDFGQAVREYFALWNEKQNLKDKIARICVDFNSLTFKDAINETKKLISENHDVRYLFEGAFSYRDKLRVRPDVLEFVGGNRVRIYEAKASTYSKEKSDNDIKKHFLDIAYQVYVMQKLGFVVDGVFLCFIDRNYYRGFKPKAEITFFDQADSYKDFVKTKSLDYEKDVMPIIADIMENGVPPVTETQDLDFEHFVYLMDESQKGINLLERIQPILEIIPETIEQIDNDLEKVCVSDDVLLDYLSDEESCNSFAFARTGNAVKLKKANCKFIWTYRDLEVPNVTYFFPPSKTLEFLQKYKIFNLEDLSKKELFSYCKNNKNEDPWFKPNDAKRLNLILKKAHHEVIDDSELLLNKEGFDLAFQEYKFPVYMYDFETSSWAVPPFNNQVGYDQTVFQYSIHTILEEKDYFNGAYQMQHSAWLKKDQEDPRPEFLAHFLLDAFKYGPGTYVSYNKSFEIGVLRKLAVVFPKYKDALLYICQNTIDLIDFFKKDDGYVYHPGFKRSRSIKYTQPALYPDLQYTDLVVNKGDKASFLFKSYINNALGEDSKKIWTTVHYNPMLAYCNRDTEAMVVLFKRLIEIKKAVEEEK